MGARAIFLDRDGVLTRERPDYVKTPDELEILPGIYEPLRQVRQKGYRIIVVTNQSVIGRGLAKHSDMARIHDRLLRDLAIHGCSVDAIYYCPHLPEDHCGCRKPEPGLIIRATNELDIDLKRSWMIGDKDIDLEAARRAGCRGLKVPTNGNGLKDAVHRIALAENDSEAIGSS
jgi:histidinol-phosphate phosphatase family protein